MRFGGVIAAWVPVRYRGTAQGSTAKRMPMLAVCYDAERDRTYADREFLLSEAVGFE